MVVVVGNKEIGKVAPLSVFLFIVSKLQTTIFFIVVSLYCFLTIINYSCRQQSFSTYQWEVYNISFLPTCRIKAACTQENTHHIVNTFLLRTGFPMLFPIVVYSVLFCLNLPIRIRIEHFVYRISLSFLCTFAIIKRCQVLCVVTKQCIAQNKELIGPLAAPCDEASLVGRLLVEGGLDDVERRCAGLYPYKTLVVIEVIVQALARFEGCILVCTLCLYRI